MRDFVSAVFGEITTGELALVGLIFFFILAFGWAPRAGAWVGDLFDADEES